MMISTIVISRNSRPYIADCIESIRLQTRKTGEIIVVDGKSTDGTFEWLKTEQDLITLEQSGTGIAQARNQGILASKGEWISFLDSDDTWNPEKLSLQSLVLEEKPHLHAITANLTKSDEKSERTWPAMTPGGFLFRREVFDNFGLFDEQRTVASDHAWFIKAIREGMKYEVLPVTLLNKKIHEHNLSVLQKKRYRAEMMDIMRR